MSTEQKPTVEQTEQTNVVTTTPKQPKHTWIWHYRKESVKPGFDAAKFSGRLAFDRVETARKAIRAIGTPYFSDDADLPISEAGIQTIEDSLAKAVEMLIDELRDGKRNGAKTIGCIKMT